MRVVREVEIEMPDHLQKMHKRKSRFGKVDFIIINPNGKDITIELDSSNKLYSYKKLEVAQRSWQRSFLDSMEKKYFW